MSSSSESWRPTVGDITAALADLAERVGRSTGCTIEPDVAQGIRDLLNHLESSIPGIETPPDQGTGDVLCRASQMALDRGDEREALSRALRGLSFSPHDPNLWYLAAGASFEFGAVELAIRMLYHVIWIHPGHPAARTDIEGLNAFLDGSEE